VRDSERRKFPRVAKRIMLKFKCVHPELLLDRGEQIGIILDISKGGAVLRSTRTYLPGAILQLSLPETELGAARTLHARVISQRRTDSANQFDLGTMFVRWPPPQQEASAKPKTRRIGGETTRYESATLGVPTGETIRRLRVQRAPGEERRKHARWQERVYLKYRCTTKEVFNEVDYRVGLMLDFSRGGFVFAGLREYPAGSVLEVKFPDTPLGPGRTIHAKVVRTAAYEKPGQFRIACAFVAAEKSQ